MKNRLQSLDRLLKSYDMIEAFDYFPRYAKEGHAAYAHISSYPLWEADEDVGIIFGRQKGRWSHEAARESGFDSRRDSRRILHFNKKESDEAAGMLIE
ncbi:hypothetical protein CPB83DRAFT_851467 [Crepidotus variabilis]|uniref:Uncharacterized protein n=1 Tax=Crepidotus variabilis TaxID=179855 RepID=A0A9P6JRL6_9AGAR|nr:hypothetical protein CPB83DRAFT_851467 [Crepidotus variabilis]